MVFMDKDIMHYKLQIGDGATYYFAEAEHMIRGLQQGGFGIMRNASYAIKDGKFLKNRSSGESLPNAILLLGREKINELFDFMEKHA
jgi:hypothetical protein